MFEPLVNFFPRVLNKVGITRQARAAHVCEKYRRIAPSLIRADILEHTFPKSYQRKILTIGVENSSWGYTVMQHKDDLLKAINTSLGTNLLQDIKTRVGQINPPSC